MNESALPGRILRFAVSDGGVWVTAWVAVLLVLTLLLIIAHQVRAADLDSETSTVDLTMSGVFRYVRRHSNRGGTYVQDLVPLMPRLPQSHWAITNTQWHDSEHPIDAPTTGRHSIHNLARTIVPSDWCPPIGGVRIALIETPTSQYAILQRSKLVGSEA